MNRPFLIPPRWLGLGRALRRRDTTADERPWLGAEAWVELPETERRGERS